MDFNQIKQHLSIFISDDPYIQALAVVVAALVAARVANMILTRIFPRLTRRTKSELDDQILALLRRPVFVTVALIGLTIAYKLVTEDGSEMERVGVNVIQTLIALVWLVFAIRLLSLLLRWMSDEESRFTLVQPATTPLLNIFSKVVVIAGAAYAILLAWNIDVTAWLASAGILGLAIGLAAQETLANLFAGVSILTDAPYKIGDYIILDNSERGEVTKIGLRSTRILTRDQIEVTVPNSVIAQSKIVNESGGPSIQRRLRIPIGVAYGSDAAQVEKILRKVAESEPELAEHPRPHVRFVNFGDSSLDFEVRGWLREPVDRGRVLSKLNFAIYQALNEAGIEIPFPKRDLYIKELPKGFSVTQASGLSNPKTGSSS